MHLRSATIAMIIGCGFPALAQNFSLSDSLRGSTQGNPVGGSIGPNGWTVTAGTDRLWYAIPTLVSGSIEFTLSNVTLANLDLSDNEMFAMYEAGYGMSEPIPYGPDFRENHYKAMLRIYGTPEPGRVGQQKLMWGMCPSGSPGYGSCGCGSFFEEPFGGHGTWDGSPQQFRIEWGNGLTRLLRNGTQVVEVDWSSSGIQFGPSNLHFSLGTSRPSAWSDSQLPIGAVFTDVEVRGVIGTTATCGGGGGSVDAGADPCPAGVPRLTASLSPQDSAGRTQTFRASYSNCEGAGALRVVQLTVADEVAATVPRVDPAYEAGAFHFNGQSCAPGEARVLSSSLGGLDCKASSASASGKALVVDYALRFESGTFAGARKVFVDAKGGQLSPEPRLGWTELGRHLVPPPDVEPVDSGQPNPDAGAVADAGADAGAEVADAGDPDTDGGLASPPPESTHLAGGCGCGAGGAGAALFPILVLAGWSRRVRRQAR